MRLDKFDLNLLLAFEVLIEERNVTRAARRLNLTQSAMSGALKRLRDAFSDEILIQQGKKMFPTAVALALAPEISALISDLRGLLTQELKFNPETSERLFRIVTSDYIAAVLIGPMMKQLQLEAPNVRLELILPDAKVYDGLEDGRTDLIIAPERYMLSAHPRELLMEERYVLVGWSGNEILERPITREVYEALGHVAVSVGSDGTFAENYLREHSDKRRIELTCAAFSEVAWMLPGTTRVALMHERLARIYAQFLPLRVCEPPVNLPVLREMLMHHSAKAQDPGLTWLRNKLLDAAAAT